MAARFLRTPGDAGQQSLLHRRKVRELRFRLWGEKLRSLPCARRKSPWGTPPLPTEPTSLGFGGDPVREVASARTAEGLMQSSWFSCAKSDYSMSKNPATHNRKPHVETNRWGTIPQSAKLTAPFTQRGLWCGGIQRVRWKIETAVQEPLRQHS